VTARSLDDGLVMAVEHVTWPLRGVQFHPESVGTPEGRALLRNFLGLGSGASLRRTPG
jgi:anthranilate synthase component 2